MSLLHRRDSGRPIREAMADAGISGPELSDRTRDVDELGRGVSAAVIGFLAGNGVSARERCRLRTAWLIADALDRPLQALFMLPESTFTEERSTLHGSENSR